MRVFYAIEFTEYEKEKIKGVQKELSTQVVSGRMTDVENFHLTLKFIGEIDSEELRSKIEVLENLCRGFKRFNVKVNKLGEFRKRNKSIIWLGIEEKQEFDDIYIKLETLIKSEMNLGVENEYSPHITLGRNIKLKYPLNEQLLCDSFELGIKRISLMESKRVDDKLIYEAIKYQYLKEE